jgi:hypothetical protein
MVMIHTLQIKGGNMNNKDYVKLRIPFPAFLFWFILLAVSSIVLALKVNGWLGFIPLVYLIAMIKWEKHGN